MYLKVMRGQFHTDYPGCKRKVMGMDGYGGQAIVIDLKIRIYVLISL